MRLNYRRLTSNQALRATVAGDGQVRVHELGEIGTSGPPATSHLSSRHTCIHRLRCHDRRVKRLVTEDSPHLFLTVAEVVDIYFVLIMQTHDLQGWYCTAT